jgi:hypothetical protein
LGVQARYLVKSKHANELTLCLIGERGLQLRIERGNVERLRHNAPNTPALVKYDSLPSSWQELLIRKFGEPQVQYRRSLFEQEYRREAKFFDELCNLKLPDGKRLSDADLDRYTTNASVLATMGRIYKHQLKNWMDVCAQANDFRAIVGHTLPNSAAMLKQQLKILTTAGAAGIVSKKYGWKNAQKVTAEIERFICALFADYQTKPTKEETARRYSAFLQGEIEVINNLTGEVYSQDTFPELSVSTVVNYLSKWRNEIATYGKRSGNRQVFMGKFKPYHSMEVEQAGSIISVDDRQPPVCYGKGQRVWLYIGQDIGSTAITCWVHGKTKEGIMLDFYRQMARNYAEWGINLPAELEAEASLNSAFKETFLKQGNMFQYVHIEPNNARGKYIERTNKEFRYSEKYEKGREGWLARPDKEVSFEPYAQGPGGHAKVPHLPYNQIVQEILIDIQNWNNSEHPHIKGKSRWEVFMEMQNPDIQPTNYRGIIPYLGYETRTSCNAGIIRLNNGEFLLGLDGKVAVGEDLVAIMDTIAGCQINVKWLDGNDGKVLKAYAYNMQGEFLCEIIAKPVYHRARIERTAEDEAMLELMSKYVASIEGYGRRRRKEIEPLTLIDNRKHTLNDKFKITNNDSLVTTADNIASFPLSGGNNAAKPSYLEREQAEILDAEEDLEADLITVKTSFNKNKKNINW